MKKLKFRETVFVASMLFGMFFGAGNLIFPVSMGQMAGKMCIRDSCVIVQDFGTARMAAGSYKNIRLIWGQMGRVRERRYSDEFLQFLKERGFTGMETGDQELAGRLYSFGLVPFFDNALLQYQTLGRICYLEYETGRCEPELCRQGCYSLRAGGEEYEMTIDGYMLGKKYRMIPENILETVHKKYGAELIFRKK